MKINIYCVGKIKEKFYTDAIKEYSKRLSRYCKLNIIEVNDEKTPDNASDKEIDNIKQVEGQRLLSKIRDNEFVFALAIEGKAYSSTAFANELNDLSIKGTSDIAFVIGGSLGLSDEVLKRANAKISFSEMTFPHQLMRVILLEQVYRSFRIIKGEPYHK